MKRIILLITIIGIYQSNYGMRKLIQRKKEDTIKLLNESRFALNITYAQKHFHLEPGQSENIVRPIIRGLLEIHPEAFQDEQPKPIRDYFDAQANSVTITEAETDLIDICCCLLTCCCGGEELCETRLILWTPHR